MTPDKLNPENRYSCSPAGNASVQVYLHGVISQTILTFITTIPYIYITLTKILASILSFSMNINQLWLVFHRNFSWNELFCYKRKITQLHSAGYEKNSLRHYCKKQGNTGTKQKTGDKKNAPRIYEIFLDPLSGEYKLTDAS